MSIHVFDQLKVLYYLSLFQNKHTFIYLNIHIVIVRKYTLPSVIVVYAESTWNDKNVLDKTVLWSQGKKMYRYYVGDNCGDALSGVVRLVIDAVYWWVVVNVLLICSPSEVPQAEPSYVAEVELLALSEVPHAEPSEVAEVGLPLLDA